MQACSWRLRASRAGLAAVFALFALLQAPVAAAGAITCLFAPDCVAHGSPSACVTADTRMTINAARDGLRYQGRAFRVINARPHVAGAVLVLAETWREEILLEVAGPFSVLFVFPDKSAPVYTLHRGTCTGEF